jgi:hypothetical protein
MMVMMVMKGSSRWFRMIAAIVLCLFAVAISGSLGIKTPEKTQAGQDSREDADSLGTPVMGNSPNHHVRTPESRNHVQVHAHRPAGMAHSLRSHDAGRAGLSPRISNGEDDPNNYMTPVRENDNEDQRLLPAHQQLHDNGHPDMDHENESMFRTPALGYNVPAPRLPSFSVHSANNRAMEDSNLPPPNGNLRMPGFNGNEERPIYIRPRPIRSSETNGYRSHGYGINLPPRSNRQVTPPNSAASSDAENEEESSMKNGHGRANRFRSARKY